MVTPPKKWIYIEVVLEIDEKEVTKQIASHTTFQDIFKRLQREGQTQRLPWAIFISKSNYLKPRVIPDVRWQKRDSNGKFLKTLQTT